MTVRRTDVAAITFDFGNTLLPVDRASLRRVVEVTVERLRGPLGPLPREPFLHVWAEERDRQFREEVPRFREVDLAERFVRVLARLRGMPAPPPDVPWDQAAAATHVDDGEVEAAVEVYSGAFVDTMPVPPDVGRVLGTLAAGFRLGVLSNWPLAATIERYLAAAGWDRWLDPVVVSQRVGTIKPHPAIFAAALEALGGLSPSQVLHVGDDWAADVVGGKQAGWRVAWLHVRPGDSPLPGSEPDWSVAPDLEIGSLQELVRLTTGEPSEFVTDAAAATADRRRSRPRPRLP